MILNNRNLLCAIVSESECIDNNHMKKVLEFMAVDGRIHSLQWVSSEDILVCSSEGHMHLWQLFQGMCFSFLPKFKEHV